MSIGVRSRRRSKGQSDQGRSAYVDRVDGELTPKGHARPLPSWALSCFGFISPSLHSRPPRSIGRFRPMSSGKWRPDNGYSLTTT